MFRLLRQQRLENLLALSLGRGKRALGRRTSASKEYLDVLPAPPPGFRRSVGNWLHPNPTIDPAIAMHRSRMSLIVAVGNADHVSEILAQDRTQAIRRAGGVASTWRDVLLRLVQLLYHIRPVRRSVGLLSVASADFGETGKRDGEQRDRQPDPADPVALSGHCRPSAGPDEILMQVGRARWRQRDDNRSSCPAFRGRRRCNVAPLLRP